MRAWSRLAGLGALLLTSAVHAATIAGTVFEDINYGGGTGRARAPAGGIGLPGVRVEIYSGNTWVTAITTGADGSFSYAYSGHGARTLRVVNGTVRSSRNAGCTTCVPVQTYRTAGATNSNTPTPVVDRVGGENPALSDAPANTSSASLSSLSTAAQRVQTLATIDPASNGATVSNVDFGFNFDTIVNTRDPSSCTPTSGSPATFYPCQGSLRQFVINANALAGEAALAQAGSGEVDGVVTALPSARESSVFMIPNGAANPGQNTGYANQLTAGVAIVTLGSALPAVTGASTRLDATTQTVNVGNTNAGTVGTGGAVGVDALSLPTFQRPEVQLSAANTQVVLSGADQSIVGFALAQGYLLLSGAGGLARNNLVGMSANGDSSATTNGIGIAFQGTGATVRNNFVTVNNSGIRTDNGGAGSLITLNEVARPTSGHTNTFDGILLVGNVSNTQVTANLVRDQQGGGIEIGFGGGAPATNITVDNNTIRNNGFTSGSAPSTEPVGFVAYSAAGSNVLVTRNVLESNAGPGALVVAASGTIFSQNRFSNNGGLSIDLDPRGLDPNTMGSPQGVTLNDPGDTDTGPNGLLNFPVIADARLIGSELLLSGFARPGSALELYLAQPDPSGFGEGLAYLGTLTEGSGADTDATTGTYGPAVVSGVAQGSDNTNRFSFRIPAPSGVAIGVPLTATATLAGVTSEFGGNVIVTGGPSLLHLKSVQVISDPANGSTDPKSIPGSVQLYVLRITNQGAGAVDADSLSVTDAIPPGTRLFVGDVAGPGSGPVAFVDGSPGSGLTYAFTGLGNATDDVAFSSDGGATWTYTPVADADGCDAAVTHVRMAPKGTMPGNGAGDPYFELRFQVRVQ